jgi:hypothetical protein
LYYSIMAKGRFNIQFRPGLDDVQASVVDRVMANRPMLIIALIASTFFVFISLLLTGIISTRRAVNPGWGWPLLVLSVLALFATIRQILWPVPLIEVTTHGVRLRILAPMTQHGLFFVPWSHVQAVVLTQVATSRGARAPALGLRIVQDDVVHLPAVRWNSSHAAPDAPDCDVVFAESMLEGDAAKWARKIEAFRGSLQMAAPDRSGT